MPLRANYDPLIKRGFSYDNTEYHFVRCPLCGEFALYEEELMQLYTDPRRPGRHPFYNFDPVECPSCGRQTVFEYADESHIDAIRNSPWAFALPDTI